VTRTYQNIRLFGGLSAADNVVVGEHLRRDAPLWRWMLMLPSAGAEQRRARDRALEFLERVGLGARADEKAQNLSYGEQRRVESPGPGLGRVLLLDGLFAGMNSGEWPPSPGSSAEWPRPQCCGGAQREAGDGRPRPHPVLNFGKVIADRRPRYLGPGGHRRLSWGGAVSGATPLLEVSDLHVGYGHVQAVRGVSLRVGEGQIVTLIGPNGAGKSSTLAAVAGLVRPEGGSIRLEGREVSGLPSHRAVAEGVVLVPEWRAVLARMTVEENLQVAVEGSPRGEVDRLWEALEEQYRRFPGLGERRRQAAGTLSGGEQQMLAIARGLLARPRILLLDEPSMGLAPLLVRQIFDMVAQIHREGTTILLVEQNARLALEVSDHAYVLERGQIAVEGPSKELAADPRVQAAYLGGAVAAG
jgi:branched-chain amino acid transport system ATP-binding protein